MHRFLPRLVLVALTLGSLTAPAQSTSFSRGIDTVVFKPTPAQDSGIVLEGARPVPRRSVRGGLLLDFNLHTLALNLGDEKIGNLIPYRLDAHALLAYQLHERLELGVDLPFTVLQGDNFGQVRDFFGGAAPPGAGEGVSTVGLGDLRLVPRAFLLDPERFPLGLALVAELRLPTGDAGSFLGDRGVVFAPRLALERAFGPVRLLGNLGVRLRRGADFLLIHVGHQYTAGLGAVVSLPDMGRLADVKLLGELHLATPTTDPLTSERADSLKTPLEALAGVRARVAGPWGLELNLGRGIGARGGYGREALRVMAGLRYERVFLDADGDGVTDVQDRCPTEKEDRDGFQDSDGCLDPDNDGDGLRDGEDACPDIAGPKEYDGCPDRDGDEVPDNLDECPDTFGPAENKGCPYDEPTDVIVEADRIRIRGDIRFETGSARIQKESFPLLNSVAAVLLKNPELSPVLVEGHTDNRGSRPYNLDLSERRARSVVDYLVSKGVARERLRSAGFGFDRPIDTNGNALGRARNRRVEFRLLRDDDGDGNGKGKANDGAKTSP